MTNAPLSTKSLFAHPANFFALGAGAGLAPKAPGTFGTLVGIPVLFLMPQNFTAYLICTVLLFAFGVWCCHVCARELGVHDHPGIVWDEVVGYLITMVLLPRSLWWVLAGFVVFRFFDILKPWPISWVDKHVHGGLGIMLDDVLAALFSVVVLQIVYRLL